jgi:hypothetical protein
MKILIIAIPRSGSTTLITSLSSILNLKRIDEPFNNSLYKNIQYDTILVDAIRTLPKDDVIVKSLISINVSNLINFYKSYSKMFDKVIILSRKSTKDAAESFAYQKLKDYTKDDNWHAKWRYPKNGDELYEIDKYIEWMVETKKWLEILSKELNVDIDWYEDLYSGKKRKINKFLKKHQLDIDKSEFYEYLNPKHRLRQFEKTRI